MKQSYMFLLPHILERAADVCRNPSRTDGILIVILHFSPLQAVLSKRRFLKNKVLLRKTTIWGSKKKSVNTKCYFRTVYTLNSMVAADAFANADVHAPPMGVPTKPVKSTTCVKVGSSPDGSVSAAL
jgi:hypothetical protein